MKRFKCHFFILISQVVALLNITVAAPLFEKGETLSITGNKRTQNSYILSVLQNCLWVWEQSDSKTSKENDIEKKLSFYKQCLLNTKLFSKVDISKKGKKVNILAID